MKCVHMIPGIANFVTFAKRNLLGTYYYMMVAKCHLVDIVKNCQGSSKTSAGLNPKKQKEVK